MAGFAKVVMPSDQPNPTVDVTGEHRAVTSAGKKSVEEFMKLSNSDQMRARREGIF